MIDPTNKAMWLLANLPTGEAMEAAVDDFLLGLGLNPGPTTAHG